MAESLVQVEMLKLAAGPDGVLQVGSKPWLDFKTAQSFVEAGSARYVVGKQQPYTEQRSVETATVEPPEKAVSQRGKRGKHA